MKFVALILAFVLFSGASVPPKPPTPPVSPIPVKKKVSTRLRSPRDASVNAVIVVPYTRLKWEGTAGEKTLVLDAPTPNGPWRVLATTTNTSYDAPRTFSERYYMVETTNTGSGFDGSVMGDYIAKHGIPPYQPGYSGRNPMQLYGAITNR